MIKILKYDNYPDHKVKLKIRQIQVLGKSTGQINNTGYEKVRPPLAVKFRDCTSVRSLDSSPEPFLR